jgi:hypothetical protein
MRLALRAPGGDFAFHHRIVLPEQFGFLSCRH